MNDEKMRELYSRGNRFLYRLLDRMRCDCEYYLGNGGRHPKHLWADTESEHIEIMESIWNHFAEKDKPEWLTLEQIEKYKKEMVTLPD